MVLMKKTTNYITKSWAEFNMILPFIDSRNLEISESIAAWKVFLSLVVQGWNTI